MAKTKLSKTKARVTREQSPEESVRRNTKKLPSPFIDWTRLSVKMSNLKSNLVRLSDRQTDGRFKYRDGRKADGREQPRT